MFFKWKAERKKGRKGRMKKERGEKRGQTGKGGERNLSLKLHSHK